jgi:hypothetical protein
MRPHGGLKEEEADDALWEAGRGAVAGAARVNFLSSNEVVLLRFEHVTDNITVGILHSCFGSRCVRLLACLSGIDYPIQSV